MAWHAVILTPTAAVLLRSPGCRTCQPLSALAAGGRGGGLTEFYCAVSCVQLPLHDGATGFVCLVVEMGRVALVEARQAGSKSRWVRHASSRRLDYATSSASRVEPAFQKVSIAILNCYEEVAPINDIRNHAACSGMHIGSEKAGRRPVCVSALILLHTLDAKAWHRTQRAPTIV